MGGRRTVPLVKKPSICAWFRKYQKNVPSVPVFPGFRPRVSRHWDPLYDLR